jgi:hypothetical protein
MFNTIQPAKHDQYEFISGQAVRSEWLECISDRTLEMRFKTLAKVTSKETNNTVQTGISEFWKDGKVIRRRCRLCAN